MDYKILHLSDLHLDASFDGQGFPIEYGNERRLGLRATLTRIFSKAREYKVNAVTIGGDLFEQKYLHPETSDFIQQQLILLDPIRVIIVPGKHDSYTNESVYAQFDWPENVEIFYQSKLAHKELAPNIHLWGACNLSEHGPRLFDGFVPMKGTNILLAYATRDATSKETKIINADAVQRAGFHLALLGGEHKSVMSQTKNFLFIYPGSPEPLSPLEANELHQVALIELNGENIHIQHLSFQQWHYRTIYVDLTNCTSNAEAAYHIETALKNEANKMSSVAITVVLKGKPTFDLNMFDLPKLITSPVFFHLKSSFELIYNLEKLASEQTVRGLLVKRFLARIHSATNESERNQQLTALHFALQALDGRQVSLYETKAD